MVSASPLPSKSPPFLSGEQIAEHLNSTGYLVIPGFQSHLTGGDLQRAFFALSEQIGTPIAHDSTGTIIWDIKTRDKGADENRVITYSEHNHEADLHTDSQYSEYPEDYFGLLTLKKADCGGGISYLLSLKNILEEMSATTTGRQHMEVLRTTNYPFIVPNIFRKHTGDQPEFNYGPILRNNEIRFRIDTFEKALLAAPNSCTKKQLAAFDFLKNLVRTTKSTKKFFLETGDLIFINNKTMLHGRGSFKDAQRHLLRIRMNKFQKKVG